MTRKLVLTALIIVMIFCIIGLTGCSGNEVQGVNINDMDDLIGKVNLIDIREPSEYAGGTLRTAVNIPMNDLLANPDDYLDKDQTYYIMCRSGARSKKTTDTLSDKGYKVVNVLGGYSAYKGTNRE